MSIEWSNLGIPSGYGPYKLLYNCSSGMLVAELRNLNGEAPHQLYGRHREERVYKPIVVLEPLVSAESAVTPSDAPIVFYNCHRWTKTEDGYGGHWEGLYSSDLNSLKQTEILRSDNFRLPEAYERGWVSFLMGSSCDAQELSICLGLQTGYQAHYYLALLQVATAKLQLVSRLDGAFF